MKATPFTVSEDEFIKANYLDLPVKRMCKLMNRSSCGVLGRLAKMGLVIPAELIAERKQKGMYRKGATPANKGKKQTEYMSVEAIEATKKTRFKKGDVPNNRRPDFAERESKGGYLEVRLPYRNNTNKFERKQRYLYEQYHDVVLNATDVIIFKDGNKRNFEKENLERIDRVENMSRNTIQRFPKDLQLSIKLVSKIDKLLTNKNQQQ